MAVVQVVFRRCVVNSKSPGVDAPDLDHLVSQVFFEMSNGTRTLKAVVDVRQPYGIDYEAGPLEVRLSADSPYRGPFPPESFGEALGRYYRRLVGQQIRF